MHRRSSGLRLHILSILAWAMIPILAILISVGRTRPSHHQFRADGDLWQRWGRDVYQRTCGWNAADHHKHH